MDPALPLLRVCRLLNEARANYLVCGAHACILHGLVRTTEDVDILIEPTEENCRRVIQGLAGLEDGAAGELTPADLIDNVVVKVADEVEVDVSTKAWKVTSVVRKAIGRHLTRWLESAGLRHGTGPDRRTPESARRTRRSRGCIFCVSRSD